MVALLDQSGLLFLQYSDLAPNLDHLLRQRLVLHLVLIQRLFRAVRVLL